MPSIEQQERRIDKLEQIVRSLNAKLATRDRAAGGGGGAPVDATYVTVSADSRLTNETALNSLGSGLLQANSISTPISTKGGFDSVISDGNAVWQGDNINGSVTGTKSDFDAACSDGNFLYTGDTGAMATMVGQAGLFYTGHAPAASTSYYMAGFFGLPPGAASSGGGLIYNYSGKTITIKAVQCYFVCTVPDSGVGSGNNATVYVRVGNTTDNTIGTIKFNAATNTLANNAMSVDVASGSYFEIKFTTPTWGTTPPSGVLYYWQVQWVTTT